jgi:hypothetical protein
MTNASMLGKSVRHNNKKLMEDLDKKNNHQKNNDPNTINIKITKDENGASGIDLFSAENKKRIFLLTESIAIMEDLGDHEEQIKEYKRQKLVIFNQMMQDLNSHSNTAPSSSSSARGVEIETPITTTTTTSTSTNFTPSTSTNSNI